MWVLTAEGIDSFRDLARGQVTKRKGEADLENAYSRPVTAR